MHALAGRFFFVVAYCLLTFSIALAQDDAVRTVLVRVVDVEGNPLADAGLKLMFRIAFNVEERSSITDEAGIGIIEFPANAERPALQVTKKGYVGQARRWRRFGEEVPDDISVVLEKGSTIGGEVQNERGQPIAEAKVGLLIEGERSADGNQNLVILSGSDAPRTDKNGRWSYEGVPPNAKIRLSVSHPAYWGDNDGQFTTAYERASPEDLREHTALAKLADGVHISGQVIDVNDRPIAGAVATARLTPPKYSANLTDTTDSDGQFELPAGPNGTYDLVVSAKGYSPNFLTTDGGKDRPLKIKLERGRPVRLRVLDFEDKPLQALIEMKEHGRIRPSLLYHPKTQIPFATDSDGRFVWENAPDGELKFYVAAAPWHKPKDLTIGLEEREKEIVVRLEREPVFSGRVIDRTTREPIDRFLVVPIQPGSAIYRQGAIIGKKGLFQIPAHIYKSDVSNGGYGASSYLYIEHPGHRSLLTEDSYDFAKPEKELVLEMDKAEPVSGTVIDPDGKPEPLATVAINEANSGLFSVTKLNFGNVGTDDEGRFQMPAPPGDYSIVVQSPAGFLQKSFSSKKLNVGELQLTPWAVVSGIVLDQEGKPVPKVPILLHAPDLPQLVVSIESGPDGTFRFDQVPNQKCEIHALVNNSGNYEFSNRQKFSPKPGEKIEITLKMEKQSR